MPWNEVSAIDGKQAQFHSAPTRSPPPTTSWPRLVPATHRQANKSRSRFEAAWWVAGTSRGHDVDWGEVIGLGMIGVEDREAEAEQEV